MGTIGLREGKSLLFSANSSDIRFCPCSLCLFRHQVCPCSPLLSVQLTSGIPHMSLFQEGLSGSVEGTFGAVKCPARCCGSASTARCWGRRPEVGPATCPPSFAANWRCRLWKDAHQVLESAHQVLESVPVRRRVLGAEVVAQTLLGTVVQSCSQCDHCQKLSPLPACQPCPTQILSSECLLSAPLARGLVVRLQWEGLASEEARAGE